MGGEGILKKVWREALFAAPRPVLGHPPLPHRGGVGAPENSGTEYLYYYMRQPLEVVKVKAYFAK